MQEGAREISITRCKNETTMGQPSSKKPILTLVFSNELSRQCICAGANHVHGLKIPRTDSWQRRQNNMVISNHSKPALGLRLFWQPSLRLHLGLGRGAELEGQQKLPA